MTNTHPYYPQDLHLPSWRPSTTPVSTLFLHFSLIFSLPIVIAYFTVIQPRIQRPRTRLAAIWLLQNALLHFIYEGFWVWTCLGVFLRDGKGWGDAVAGSQTVLGALHREYSKSDSRYLQDDVFVLGVETLTVLIQGPLTAAAFFAHLRPRTVHLHLLRLTCSTIHIAFTLLYFITEELKHNADCRPEFVYRWVYMVGMNIPWVLVPLSLIIHDWIGLMKLVKALEQGNTKAKKAQ